MQVSDKAFIQTAIIYNFNLHNIGCIATAFSGIASTVLLGGRISHNVFKMLIHILENSLTNITANGRLCTFHKFIIIDNYC